MPIKKKGALIDSQRNYLEGNFSNISSENFIENNDGLNLPKNVVAAFFSREEVNMLVNSLTTDYIKVFLIKKTAPDSNSCISMAMTGANEKSNGSIGRLEGQFMNLNLGDGNHEFGLEATKECPPHCQLTGPVDRSLKTGNIGVVHIPPR